MTRIAVLVSGGGTNLQALIDVRATLGGELVCVLSSAADAYALERAAQAGIPTRVVARVRGQSRERYTDRLLAALEDVKPDLVVLSGFLVIVGSAFVQAYPNRVINVHPALLPAFGGPGCYGLRVHEMALQRGVKLTGATVHFVNEETDDGPIIAQKCVAVQPGDTPESLQRRVMEQAEWQLLPHAVRLFCEGRLEVVGNTVVVRKQSQLNCSGRDEDA